MADTEDKVDVLSETVAEPPKRGRGRPKGLGKVPGSGRKAGTKNWTSEEIRSALLDKSGAIETLAAICSGQKLTVSGPTGKVIQVYPTLPDRLRAAELVLKKVVPDLQSQSLEVTGKDGAPFIPEQERNPRHLARAIVALLGEGVPADVDDDAGDEVPRAAHEFTATRYETKDERAALDLSDPGTMPAMGERVLVGDKGCWIERQADGRWMVLHSDGVLHRYVRDRDEAERQAEGLRW